MTTMTRFAGLAAAALICTAAGAGAARASDDFWAGTRKAPAARAEPAPAAKAPTLADLAAAEQAVVDVWTRLPFAARRAMFVREKAEVFGGYDARPTSVFTQGETLLSYIEPVGYGWKPVGSDTVEFGITADFEILDRAGKVLGGQKGLLNSRLVSHAKNREFFINLSMSLDGAPPGDYVLAYILTDAATGRTTRVEQPFTLRAGTAKADPAPVSPPPAPGRG
ncbi:hypothetical protein [uncultured Methylobacterium sp.]|jgi:hypothetical protein|uniref:hypothetical protein n=1 Tax=uncultured Methylobacterium sp. TaxID=157278 RepID=UPI0026243882|nr:hypothetical protein [uncultured Methylobacterium sp.]